MRLPVAPPAAPTPAARTRRRPGPAKAARPLLPIAANIRHDPTPTPHTPSPAPQLPYHPTILLDAACAACCVALLATSAARHVSAAAATRASKQQASYGACEGTTAVPAELGTARLSAATVGSQTATAGATYGQSTGTDLRKLVRTMPPPALRTSCPPPPHSYGSQTPGLVGVALTACSLLMALGNMAFKLEQRNRRHNAPVGVSAEAAARLARLEALTDKQLAEFSTAVRQIDKLQVRTRVTSGDIRRPIAQLQSATADQSAVLTRLASEQEVLRGQLRDTQRLLAALQGLTAKQFQVTVDAIKQLRAQQAASGAAG